MNARQYLALIAGAVALVVGAYTLQSADPRSPKPVPTELGRVAWERDYTVALARAQKEKKPLLVLFDEVPGCETCKNFGNGPLSHPLIVDAATEFVPVAITNNVAGADAVLLKKFNEPAWNNPVVRFLNADETELIPRKDGEYTAGFLLARMVLALEKAGRPIPEYLKIVAAESAPSARERGVFAMYCYWEGEAKLGKLNGVLGTRIGMLEGSEVVDVEFDPKVLTYQKLVEAAKELDCTHRVFARTEDQLKTARGVVGNKAVRSDKAVDAETTQQYHLAHYPEYHYLPLTALQATRVNATLADRKWPTDLLSPGQVVLAKRIKESLAANPKLLADLRPNRSSDKIAKYAVELDKLLAK